MESKLEMSFTSKILRFFLLLAFGYFLTSYARTLTAMIASKVEAQLHLTTTLMGFISSMFFFGYALFQVPAGFLFDRFGVKRTQAGLFCIAGIGSILFGMGSSVSLLIIGRLLIGIGFAGGLTIAFSENRILFSHKRLPFLNGIIFACGGLGAVACGIPTEHLLRDLSWQTISIWAGIITFVAAFLMVTVFPKAEPKDKTETFGELFSGLKKVFTSRYFWKISPLTNLTSASILAMQSYWISPWLRKTINADSQTLSYYLLASAIGLVFSSPISGILSSLFSKYKFHKEWICWIGGALSIVMQILIVLQIWTHTEVLWGLFSFFAIFPLLGVTAVTLYFPKEFSGRAATAVNLLTFIWSFVLQYVFGLIALYNIDGGFWTFIILQVLALVWFCFGKIKPYVDENSLDILNS